MRPSRLGFLDSPQRQVPGAFARFTTLAQFLHDLAVLFAAEGVEDREDDAARKKKGGDRADHEADAREGAGRLNGGCRLVAGQFQNKQGKRDGDGIGHLAHQGDETVEDTLMTLVGFPFIPFNGVGDDGPGEHLGGAYPNARHNAQHEDHPERRFGRHHDEHHHDHRPEGNTDDVSQALAPMAGCPVPEGQRQDSGDEDAGHDDAALVFALDDVLDVNEQVGLDHQNGHPGEQVDARAEDERPVLEGGFKRGDEFGPLLADEFLPFAGSEEHADKRRGGYRACDDTHEEHAFGILRDHGTDNHHGEDIGGETTENIEKHAKRGEPGALIVVLGQLRREGEIGHINRGGKGFVDDVAEGVINNQTGLAEIGAEPEKDEGKGEGQRAKEQKWPAAPPAGARSIRQVADDGVVDIVPAAADKQDDGHQTGRHADDIHHEDGVKSRNDGIVHAEPQVTAAVDDLGPE